MNRKMIAGIFAASVCTLAQSQTGLHAATVTLDGDWYLQAGKVLNLSEAGIHVTGVSYSMGAAADGIGVWEDHDGGGYREDRLAGSTTHYSTQVWTGLHLHSQDTWTFDGLDLDRIVRTETGEVDSQNLDFAGHSLRHAYIELRFSDGFEARAPLWQQGWDVTQVLHIGGPVSAVPEPASAALLAAGAVLLWCRRRMAGSTA
jgi:hypothetical protein